MTSKEGFSVVAPIRIIIHCSTAPSNESCWDLLNLCISSMNKTGLGWSKNCCFFAFSIVSRTSLTPELIALRLKKGLFCWLAIILARVVFPTPGGPHRMNEASFPDSIIFRRTLPSATRCSCPTKSSRFMGLIRSARG